MLTESYDLALKLAKVFRAKFPGIDVETFAIDVALDYMNYISVPGASLHTCMSRSLFFKLCNEVRRIKRERQYESEIHVDKQTYAMEPLQFMELSKMAQLLLKQLQLCDSPSQWECYKELHKRGWTYRMFKKYISELRSKYVKKA
jgi:hypothetical protein